jgi:hypothetical protein
MENTAWSDQCLLIVCALASQLCLESSVSSLGLLRFAFIDIGIINNADGSGMLLGVHANSSRTINLERLDVILSILVRLHMSVRSGHFTAGVSLSMLLQPLFESECGLSTLIVKPFHLGMSGKSARFCIRGDKIFTSIDSADTVECKMICTEAMVVVGKRVGAPERSTAQKTHVEAIADNDMTLAWERSR